jgi:hypothetical protein
MDQRKNTVKVQLPGQCEKPMDAEVIRWIVQDLKMKAEELIGVAQNPANDGIIFLKCINEAIMNGLIDKYNGTSFKYNDGTLVHVEMSVASENIRYVRIFGLPFEVEDEHIAGFFGSFGVVKRLVREKFPSHYNFDVYSGVRGVHIDLKKDVPSFLYMRGFRVKIHYYGMREKCHICGSADHMKGECPKKPASVGTPAARLGTMTNLNELFKKPGVAGVSGGFSFGAPTASFARPTAGVPLAPLQPTNQQVVVTVTDENSNVDAEEPPSAGNGSKSLTVVHGNQEVEWQKVHRRTRSRTRAEQRSDHGSSRGSSAEKETTRFRTDSESSVMSGASVPASKGPRQPKKSKLIIDTIANHERDERERNPVEPDIDDMFDDSKISD